ncbi:MAG: hypothetical protein KAS63_06250 [Candidatus Heimdallarchaeota archaeon]|nr:hypothetical protein [Candidatus Heimdallarchaeota archaeon]MCK4954943.1 hypothetical protein [Candidatus Heimdallarchaeota archaeon]
MSWWRIGRRVLRRPRNVIGEILYVIGWSVMATMRYWLEMELYNYNLIFVLPVVALSVLTIVFIFKLYREMRKIVIEDHIETAEEVYERKYGDFLELKKDEGVIEILNYLESIGATRIKDTHGTVSKITFSFPIGHKYDSYQNIVLVLEKDGEINLSAELKHELPIYFNIMKKEVKEDISRKKKTFSQTYIVNSDNPEFADKILEDTLIDEVISEHESHIDLISVHGKTLSATLTQINSIELLFILLTTILVTYSR